jgi:hypothetical protein
MIQMMLASIRPEPEGWVVVMLQIGMLIFISVFVVIMVRLVLIKDPATTRRYSSLPLDEGEVEDESGADGHGSVSHG